MQQTRLNESADAQAARENLRLAEIGLMRQREKVAEMRRQLPQGPVVEEYVFQEGPIDLDAGDAPVRTVRLSELITGPHRPLVVYQFMYGKAQTSPCEMAMIDEHFVDRARCGAKIEHLRAQAYMTVRDKSFPLIELGPHMLRVRPADLDE